MKYLKEPDLSSPSPCPYLPDREFVQEYFIAHQVSMPEMDTLFAQGWRRFGIYFFRPQCPSCRECRPIRTLIRDFCPSKSQRRVLKKNNQTEFRVVPLSFRPEHFALYDKHSRLKFNKEESEEHFRESFYLPGGVGGITEYYQGETLVGLGFLDFGQESLSSVYFVYDPDYHDLSLGTFSILAEINLGQKWGRQYYNLGYWIKENRSMTYKNRFKPYQLMDWEGEIWKSPEESLDDPK